MKTKILDALSDLGYTGTFVGFEPSTVEEITDAYLSEQLNVTGEPRARLVLDGTASVTAASIRAKIIEKEQVVNIAAIKSTANDIILEHFPEWKQRNYIARALELTNVVANGGTLTGEEITEVANLQAQWDWVKQVRDVSDAAEMANTLASAVVWPSIS